MIRKTEKLVITFHTTTAAMAMERLCRERGAPGRLIPVPGSVSADCGLAWSAPPQRQGELLEIMERGGIRYQELHRCTV